MLRTCIIACLAPRRPAVPQAEGAALLRAALLMRDSGSRLPAVDGIKACWSELVAAAAAAGRERALLQLAAGSAPGLAQLRVSGAQLSLLLPLVVVACMRANMADGGIGLFGATLGALHPPIPVRESWQFDDVEEEPVSVTRPAAPHLFAVLAGGGGATACCWRTASARAARRPAGSLQRLLTALWPPKSAHAALADEACVSLVRMACDGACVLEPDGAARDNVVWVSRWLVKSPAARDLLEALIV